MYSLILLLTVAVVFLATAIATPFVFRRKTEENTPASFAETGRKVLSLWLPPVCYVLLQLVAIGICDAFSSFFSVSVLKLLYGGLILCTGAFLWIFLCAALYFLSQSVGWYFVGVLVFNVAPSLMIAECQAVYNVHPLAERVSWDPLWFHLLSLLATALMRPVYFLFLLAAVIGICFCWYWQVKRPWPIRREKAFIAYRIAAIVLASLSCGFFLFDPWMSGDQLAFAYIFAFVGVAVGAAIALAWFVFRKNRPLLRMGISLVAVAVFLVWTLGVIPAQAKREAFFLPEPEDVAGVQVFFRGESDFSADEHIEACLTLHQSILELCKEHLPEAVERPEDSPPCMADRWEQVGFRYRLKNGEQIFRSYSNLNDPAFGELFLRFLQSEAYEDSLKNIKISQEAKVQMKYFCQGKDGGVGGRLSQSRAHELVETYLDELKKAEVFVLYEEYETVQLEGVYETGDRVIYIPLSFTNTRRLAAEYTNMRLSK